MRLSDPRAALERDGFARVASVLDAIEVARLRRAVDAEALAGAVASDYGAIVHDAWRRVGALASTLEAGALGALACRLLAVDEVALFQDHLVAKGPEATAPLPWHQDYAYWPLDAPAGVTMWIALDDADEDNGCLRYVPGSHRLGERRAAAFAPGGGGGRDEHLPVIDAGPHDGVSAPVAAGDALVHHPLTWHTSPPNQSGRPRRGWSITWVAATVRWAPAHAPHPYTFSMTPGAGEPLGAAFPRFR